MPVGWVMVFCAASGMLCPQSLLALMQPRTQTPLSLLHGPSGWLAAAFPWRNRCSFMAGDNERMTDDRLEGLEQGCVEEAHWRSNWPD